MLQIIIMMEIEEVSEDDEDNEDDEVDVFFSAKRTSDGCTYLAKASSQDYSVREAPDLQAFHYMKEPLPHPCSECILTIASKRAPSR